MSGASARIGWRDPVACAPSLSLRPSPATLALTEALTLALVDLRNAWTPPGPGHGLASSATQPGRHWQAIRGAFRFCGVRSLEVLCGLMQEVMATAGDSPSSSVLHALDSACSVLLASLSSLKEGRSVPAGWLLPAWRELATHVPGPAPSASSMISLSVVDESAATCAAQAAWLPSTVSPAVHDVCAEVLDTMLLDLLRAESGSEALRASLQDMKRLFVQVVRTQTDTHHRLRWVVLLAYVELLAADAPMELTLAKKNLSLAIRGIRQAVQQSSLSIATLPDRLVREVVFQIGLFAPASPISQSLRDSFRLDWQLSAPCGGSGIELVSEQKAQWFARCEALESEWPHLGFDERHQQIREIAGALDALSDIAPLASVAASLSDLVSALRTASAEADLPLVAGVLIARMAVRAYEGSDPEQRSERAAQAHDAHDAHEALQALLDEALSVPLSSTGTSERHWWQTLNGVAPGLQRAAAMAALRSALRSVLTEAEQQLGLMIESGDSAGALRDMISTLDRVCGALVIAGAVTATRMAETLRQELCCAEQTAATGADCASSVDWQPLAMQWVQLCHWVETWTAWDNTHHGSPRPRDPLAAGIPAQSFDASPEAVLAAIGELPASSPEPADCRVDSLPGEALPGDRLEQIFIQEATQRLSRLRQALSGWAGNSSAGLPTSIAEEAHGLAGSAATVGRQRLHDGALALEQAVDYLVRLPAASQHPHADVLMHAVQVLEHELQPLPAGHPDASIPDSAMPDSAMSDALDALLMISRHPAAPSDQPAQAHEEASDQSAMAVDTLSADAELLAVFSEEAAELFPLLAKQMHDWLAHPQDEKLRSAILRLLHTLKGSARMTGQTMLGERLHRMEHEVAQRARTNSPPDPDLHGLRRELGELLAEAGLPAELQPHADAGASPSSVPATTLSQPEASSQERSPAEGVNTAPRLRNDLLERASGSAAELLVGAVRATEELQRQRQTVAELADNLLRLRTQLRELELQSESRISAQAQPSASAFDPLEFDRYTRLQELTRMTAESLADLTSLQRTLGRQTDSATAMLSLQARHARLLQSDLRRAGMQAFSGIKLRLRHLVRQVAAETGRDVRFELDGAQIEIDRQQLERLSGALQHLIRNAIVHGIELPDQREQAGKPRCGVVRLSLAQQGGELRLQISDDGRGLDLARIRARALELGVLDSAAVIDDAGLAELIFHPGLSTAEEITGLAGRGIGMDAVRAAVMHMGGALKVDSLSGAGTCITLGLPQLLSTQQVLVVSAGTQAIALPASMVQQLMQPSEAVLRQAIQEGSIEWQRQTMPLRSLNELLGLSGVPVIGTAAAHRASVVILRQLDQWLAMIVGEVLGHREVVVKQAGAQLAGVTGLAGATLQGDGSVLLIMNPLQWFDHLAPHRRIPRMSASSDPIFDNAPLVMVVDDSLTVRRVSQRLLERHGYRVAVARHGIEALEQLREITPAAMLLDIEMPRMDGFELLSRLRADARLQSVPVAMVTSRAAERHRSHAMQLGANAYFGKPYRDQELFDWLASWAPVPQALPTAA